MAHQHGHTVRPTASRPAGQRHRRRLWAAFILLVGFMVIEALAAWWTGSLALLSDAGHLATDVLGIGMALAAIHAAGAAARRSGDRPVTAGQAERALTATRHTFGLYRLEVLAALANAGLLLVVAGVVLVTAVRRFGDPPEVLAGPMLVVAAAGLVANLIAFALLRPGAQESLNVRGAYLEVLGDLVSSVGVLLAAAIILFTGWTYADPLLAVGVAGFIMVRTLALGRSALRVLLQSAPAHLPVARVEATLAAVPGVRDVHDLHVWTLTSGMEVVSAHLTIEAEERFGEILATAQRRLRDEYGVSHATLQLEPAGALPCRPDW